MSGHAGIFEVSVVVNVVNDKTLLFGVAVTSNFPEHFRGFSREHGTVDDFDESDFGGHCCFIIKIN